MRGRAEQGQGGHQGEDREDQQADSVQYDGRELPVVDDERFLFAGLDCLSDQPEQYSGGQWRTVRSNKRDLSSFSIKASSLEADMMGVAGPVGLRSFPALKYFK